MSENEDASATIGPEGVEPGAILGIDLGTTNSAVGVVDAGFPILLADESGSRLTPSVVWFPGDGSPPVVGPVARRARAMHPERVVSSVKRLMGRRAGEVDDSFPFPLIGAPREPVRFRIGEREVRPEEVSAEILRHLRGVAEARLGVVPTRAVITVPAYFNEGQRQATVRAGELAGLTVERILNEPTAAALAYGLDRLGDRSRVAVFDFGGGTFDLSVLELSDGVFRVLSTHGDTRLGGDDLDEALARWLWREACGGAAGEGAGPSAGDWSRLLEEAERVKIVLSARPEVTARLPFLAGGRHLEVAVTREAFERIAAPVLRRIVPHCRQALADAGVSASDLDEVILVGGSTRIPAVRRLAGEVFGREPDTTQHPDEAVALGAVIQAGVLSGALRQMVLLDVTPLSLGIETFGGLMNVIIPRNTTIPAKAGELFTNAVSGQQAMLVRVLQGERELAADNWELGRIEVPFEPGAKGSARMGVQFRIDENGLLEVLARDTRTGRDTVLEIRSAAVDVDDADVERMIASSVDHAFEDMAARRTVEHRMKAEELVAAVASAFEVLGGAIDPRERGEVEAAARDVVTALAAEPGSAGSSRLLDVMRRLEELTEPLAARLVEHALAEAASGAVEAEGEDETSGG